MAISVIDIFKIGLGPSSSHTVGPMRAAYQFVEELAEKNTLTNVTKIDIELYGSLALTGKGHGTDKAVLLGLSGEKPDTIDPDQIEPILEEIKNSKKIRLQGNQEIDFLEKKNIKYIRKFLKYHPNGMTVFAYNEAGNLLEKSTYYSVGGGFVVDEETASKDKLENDTHELNLPFQSADDLLKICKSKSLSISKVMYENEACFRPKEETDAYLDKIWQAMQNCIARGFTQEGQLPGSLKVKRRAKALNEELRNNPEQQLSDPLTVLDWVKLYALSVNEENASGGRVVTAPTNGAAGVLPATLSYFVKFCRPQNQQSIRDFLMTSAAIGILFAKNASISGAEVGCQGEVGVACSMAAAGLTAALGGNVDQVEQAAEIGMEHNLGLTCDPIGGLVQIPCIERNAIGAIKAISASRLALKGDGTHYVSLDSVIKTMRETGKDMKTKYKETSRGGLAVNVSAC